jgi:hypothetical protein
MTDTPKSLSITWLLFALLVLLIVSAFVRTKSSNDAPQPVVPTFVGPTMDLAQADVLLQAGTGRRKALLFGLDYKDTAFELRGCMEDVRNLGAVLRASGFDVEVCTEESAAHPTRNVLQAKLAAFLMDLEPGDMGLVWYSGHGVLLADGSNAWVPLDFQRAGFVDETWVRAHLSALPEGVRLLIGSDACHSGSTFDLKYDIEPKQALSKTASFRKVLTTKGTVQRHAFVHKDVEVDFSREHEVLDAWTNRDEMAATIVVLSGCADDETSAEGFEENEFQGVMTWAFLDVVEGLGSGVALGVLQDMMRAQLAGNNYAQTPQLSFSRLFSPNSTLAAFGL